MLVEAEEKEWRRHVEVCSKRCAQKDRAVFHSFTCLSFVASDCTCSTSLEDFERASSQVLCRWFVLISVSWWAVHHDRLLTLHIVSMAILWMVIRVSSDWNKCLFLNCWATCLSQWAKIPDFTWLLTKWLLQGAQQKCMVSLRADTGSCVLCMVYSWTELTWS